jgi:hypothetical protein
MARRGVERTGSELDVMGIVGNGKDWIGQAARERSAKDVAGFDRSGRAVRETNGTERNAGQWIGKAALDREGLDSREVDGTGEGWFTQREER